MAESSPPEPTLPAQIPPVFSRPPVDGSDAELDEWAKGFAEALLGRPLDLEPPPPHD